MLHVGGGTPEQTEQYHVCHFVTIIELLDFAIAMCASFYPQDSELARCARRLAARPPLAYLRAHHIIIAYSIACSPDCPRLEVAIDVDKKERGLTDANANKERKYTTAVHRRCVR